MTPEEYRNHDDVTRHIVATVAEIALTQRYQQQALDTLTNILRLQGTTLTSIDGQLSAINATLLAMLRELQKKG